jgi:hypothetical protein
LGNDFKNQEVEKIEDAEGNSYYSRFGKKLRRVTELAEIEVRKFWKGKRQLTEEQEALRDLARDEGSNIHNAIEKIAYKIIDPATGLFRNTFLNLGINDTNLPDDTYKKIENLVIRRLNTYKTSYGEGTRFLFEQVVYNSKKNLAGTIDFIAITPDRKVHIRDWKTTQREKNPFFDETQPESKKNRRYIQNSKKPFKIWKRLAWDTQLSEYKEAIMNIAGLTKNDFPVVRIDPILMEYSPDYKKVINISTPADDYIYDSNRQAIPYVSIAESMNNENLKTLFAKIKEIARINVERTAVETGRKFKYDYKLDEEIEVMIQDFYLFNNFEEIYKLHINTLIEVQKLLKNLQEVEEVDIDNAKFIFQELQIAKEYLGAIDSLIIAAQEVYGKNLDKSQLTEREKLVPEKVKREQDLLDGINKYSTTLTTLNEDLNNVRIRLLNSYGNHFGIKKLEETEKIVSGFNKAFTSTSSAETKSVNLLFKVLNPVWSKLRTLFRNRKETLQNLKYELDVWAKNNGKTFKEAMLFFVDQEKGKLKGKFHADFYKDRSEVLASGDIKRIKAFFEKNYKWDELKIKFDENLKTSINDIESANYTYSNPEDIEKFKKKNIKDANNKWNLDTSVDAYNYISLEYLNEENKVFQDKYYSEFFKEIKKKGN